jgi:hypothetical protein
VTVKKPLQKGDSFGELVVEERAFRKGNSVYYLCRCVCGEPIYCNSSNLRRGGNKTCGRHQNPSLMVGKSQTEGLLTVEKYIGNLKGCSKFHCRCVCGNSVEVSYSHFSSQFVKSCGCLKTIEGRQTLRKLGLLENILTGNPLHVKLKGMKDRCYNPNNQDYKDYGGRGITVCKEWLNDSWAFIKYCEENFENIYGLLKEGRSVDRILNNGNYEPGNIRFSDDVAQANNKRNNLAIEIEGSYYSLEEAIRKFAKVPRSTVMDRVYKLGWDHKKALFAERKQGNWRTKI